MQDPDDELRGVLTGYIAIPCSRHDTGENNPRVQMVLGCLLGAVIGLDEGRAEELQDFLGTLLRLHDHKGCLYIVSRDAPPDWIEDLARSFWFGLDGDLLIKANLHFVSPTSEDWDDVWESRRFASDWSSTPTH